MQDLQDDQTAPACAFAAPPPPELDLTALLSLAGSLLAVVVLALGGHAA
ncbi:hypothetical protein NON00_22640 [Roseomonas sp. GC11]|nr:hypothetical protein [Roseomonas sp. GC11]MCQ4162707.1 hypothetical protein [Roseomonas sp. GC11]